MLNGEIYQFSENRAPEPRYKIVFDDDLKTGKHQIRDFLGSWLAGVENEPEIGDRVGSDSLEQKDLFWVNDYCRHMVCFDQRPFKFLPAS